MHMSVLNPRDLGLILTYRCHSACKHCLYNCGPGRKKEAMSSEMLQQALNAILVWPQTPQVHFTGGEPFLAFSLLVEGARMASDLGITNYVETSAAWCTDDEEAAQRFVELHQAGLGAVLVSCSPFHAERIPPARTLRAIRAARRVFGTSRVIVYLPEFVDVLKSFDTESVTPLNRYEERFGVEKAGRILWAGYGIISGGRAGYRLGHLVPHYPAEAFSAQSCAAELLYAPHSHFDLYGNYVPSFCGGLVLGDWRDLPKLLDNAQEDRLPELMTILIEQGPCGLFRLARDEFGYSPLPGGYTGKCHLCVDVRRHLVREGDFPELRPAGFYDAI